MSENMKPISLKEGAIYWNGEKVLSAISLKVVVTPTVWSGKVLGDKGTNRRWTGYDITGSINEYKTTSRWVDVVKEYKSTGITPEFTIQGVRIDTDSDYYDTYGSESVTLTGVVITGDISIIQLDVDSDSVKDTINFGAKSIT